MSRRTPERDGVSVTAEDDRLKVVSAAAPAKRPSATAASRTAAKKVTQPATSEDAKDVSADSSVQTAAPELGSADEAPNGGPTDAGAAPAAPAARLVLPDDVPDAEAAATALRELWEGFKATADQSLRERLILHYSPLVKYVAGRVGVGLPPNIEQADLVSYGIFGLIDAIEKFDINRAIKFETYAISRIRGAIIDELRAIDWIPRSVRYKAREVERAYASLELSLIHI